MRRPTVSFAWYDLWVGAYVDRAKGRLYVCPLPCLLLTFERKGDLPAYEASEPDHFEGSLGANIAGDRYPGGGDVRQLHVRKGWIFWQARNPDELIGPGDWPTIVRARSRARVIEKATRRFRPKPITYEVVDIPSEAQDA